MVRTTHAVGLIGLGAASHVLAGLLPFMVARAIGRLGLVPATAWMYGIGAAALLVALAAGRWRRTFLDESAAVWHSPHRGHLVAGLVGFLIAGVAYYFGLSRSPRVAEYVFLTRLDWLLQATVAILILREPWTPQALIGGVIALVGGLILTWTSALGTSGLVAALIYIVASLAGYGGFKPITAVRGRAGAATLMVWRHWINTLGFAALLAMQSSVAMPDGVGLLLCVVGAVAIITLFLLRFTALTALPLWVLAAQAPVQATVAIVMTLVTGGSLPAATYLAIALVVVGEAFVAIGEARRASSVASA